MRKIHDFKKGHNAFRSIWDGTTTETYQENWGDIRGGDWVSFKEYVPAKDLFSGRSVCVEVIEVIDLGQFALIRFAADIVRIADLADSVEVSYESHVFML